MLVSFISLAELLLPKQADVFFLRRRRAAFLAAFLQLLVLQNVCQNAVVQGQAFNMVRFQGLVKKMQTDVMELARAVEDAYSERCEETSMNESCEQANYLDCVSMFPQQECRGGVDYSSPACHNNANGGDNNTSSSSSSSSATKCSSFYDFTTS